MLFVLYHIEKNVNFSNGQPETDFLCEPLLFIASFKYLQKHLISLTKHKVINFIAFSVFCIPCESTPQQSRLQTMRGIRLISQRSHGTHLQPFLHFISLLYPTFRYHRGLQLHSCRNFQNVQIAQQQ